jgi:hypothetical protein
MRCVVALTSAAVALTLMGCGDGEDASTETAAAPAAAAINSAPTISGAPSTTVMQGVQYQFTPAASDADGDTLSFTVTGRPAWATFDPATGALRGTPGPGDVGLHTNIVIAVTDGTASATLAAFTVNVVGTASGSVTLTWLPPTQNTDGSALTLVGYKVYWGTAAGSYAQSVTLDNPGLSSYVIDELTPATWYFVATAVSADGESAFSNVASKTIR